MINSSCPLVKTHVDIILWSTRLAQKKLQVIPVLTLSFGEKLKTLFQTASSLCCSLWKSLLLPLRLLCVSSLIQKL